MNARPSVTVIIPAFQSRATIPKALESLANQTVTPDEVIVVDDGPDKELAAVVHALYPETRIISQPNAGVAAARNTGLAAARGDWIAFLDADDEWLPERLASQLAIIAAHPEIGMVTGLHVVRFPGEADMPAIGAPEPWRDAPLRLHGAEAFELAISTSTITVLLHRSVIQEHRFRTDLRTAEDREFWYRLIPTTTVWCVGAPLARIHARPDSLTRSNVSADYSSMLGLIMELEPAIGRRSAHRWRLEVSRRWAGVLLSKGRNREAIQPAWRRVALAPWQPEGWYILSRSLFGARTK